MSASITIPQLLEAIGAIRVLQETLAKHDRLLSILADRQEGVESRLHSVEARLSSIEQVPPTAPP